MPQPIPQPGKEVVYLELEKDILKVLQASIERGGATATSRSATFPALSFLLGERVEQGREKYGTLLMTGNGRNALRDAWEECIDLCMYLKQCLMEGYPLKQFGHLLNRSLWNLYDLTRLLMWQDPELAARCGYVFPKHSAADRFDFPEWRLPEDEA